MPRLLLLPLLLLALVACATADDGPETDGATQPSAASSTTPPESPGSSPSPEPGTSTTPASEDQAYVGLSEQEALAKAEQEGVPARVVSRDGESLPRTMDFRQDRLNFALEDGRVTAVSRG